MFWDGGCSDSLVQNLVKQRCLLGISAGNNNKVNWAMNDKQAACDVATSHCKGKYICCGKG